MKEIKNWEILFEENTGKKGIGILLPGCIVKGVVDMGYIEEDIEVQALDVDISNLIITSNQGEQYKLLNVSREYIQNLNKCIEIGLKEKAEEER